ncbi:energy transducer TonB [Acetobacteraceae bacterium H6797]|nr:energy transducer TonB [Acetobacteraceae bacterium H6797]
MSITARQVRRGIIPLAVIGWAGSVLLHGGAVLPFLLSSPDPQPMGDPVEVTMEAVPQEPSENIAPEIAAQELAESPREATVAAQPPPVEAVRPAEPEPATPPPPTPLAAAEPPPPVAAPAPQPALEPPPETQQAAEPEPLPIEEPTPEPPPPPPPETIAVTPPPPPPPPPTPRDVARPRPTPAPRQQAAPPPDARVAQETVPSGGPVVAPPDTPPPSARPSAAAAPPSGYMANLARALERYKVYPTSARVRRIEGLGQVTITMGANGAVLDFRIVRSTGSEELDEAIATMVRRASPLPAPPPEILTDGKYVFTVPVRYTLR